MQEPEKTPDIPEGTVIPKHGVAKTDKVSVHINVTDDGRIRLGFSGLPQITNGAFGMAFPPDQALEMAGHLRRAANTLLGVFGTQEKYKGGKLKHGRKATKAAKRAEAERQALTDQFTKPKLRIAPPDAEPVTNAPATSDYKGVKGDDDVDLFPK